MMMNRRFKVQGSRFKVQGTGLRAQDAGLKTQVSRCRASMASVLLLAAFIFLLPSISTSSSYESMTAEAKIVRFIQSTYDRGDEIRVRLMTMPGQLKDDARVKNVSFLRMPDANGDGVCIAEVEANGGRARNIQIPFRVSVKRKLFVLRTNAGKDEMIRKEDLLVREIYMNGKTDEYPATIDDVVGRILKKDVPANTVITHLMLTDAVAVKRGEIVDIVAENPRIVVFAKGKAVDKGTLGEMIRVKNISSGKQIIGRVVAQNTVSVEF
jgi:flagella basal body P-ring formation protein FlgA